MARHHARHAAARHVSPGPLTAARVAAMGQAAGGRADRGLADADLPRAERLAVYGLEAQDFRPAMLVNADRAWHVGTIHEYSQGLK